MVRLQWSAPASAAFVNIVREHRRRVGFLAARALRERIMERISLLKDFPELGPRLAITSLDDRRMLLVSSYRIIYRVQGETVHIVDVIHARALLPDMDDEDESPPSR